MHRAGEVTREKRFRVTTAEARLRRFGRNPPWLTSTAEIKAAICLKRLNNVRHGVKHTAAALYIMCQRPAEGLLWKDNMTYPRERRRDGRRERQAPDGDRGGNEWVSNEDLTRVYHLGCVVDYGRMATATPKAPEGCLHNSVYYICISFRSATEKTCLWGLLYHPGNKLPM